MSHVAAHLLAGRYRPESLLSESKRARVLLCREATPSASGEATAPVVLKIKRQQTLFERPGSAFYGLSQLFFGPKSPDNLILHEAAALSLLHHRALPRLLHVGQHAGLPFLVTSYQSGASLATLATTAPNPRLAAAISRDLMPALDHAHTAGVYHRDISLSNILCSSEQGLWSTSLLDFELAVIQGLGVAGRVGSRQFRMSEPRPSHEPARWDGSSLGLPSQLRDADRYALGVVLFRVLCGVWPPLPGTPDAAFLFTQELRACAARRDGNPRLCEQVRTLLMLAQPSRQPPYPARLRQIAQTCRRLDQSNTALALFRQLLSTPPALELPQLAEIAESALELGDAGLAVAAALRASESPLPPDQSAQCVAPLLSTTAGQLVLLLGERSSEADLLLPLAVACTQLALTYLLTPESSSPGSSREAAALIFKMGQEAGQLGLSQAKAPSQAEIEPVILLHLAVCEWFCGAADSRDELMRQALAAGLLRTTEQNDRFGCPVPWLDTTPPGPMVLLALTLLAARQRRLCLRLVEAGDAELPAGTALTASERQQLSSCLQMSSA